MKWKKHVPTVLLFMVFFLGVALLLYPSVSNYWNKVHSSRAIANYTRQIADMTDEEYQEMLEDARSYNRRLATQNFLSPMNEEELEEYENLLGDKYSMISYIEIPKIDCTLPIYHGTDESVLNVGVGHLEGTSLPVGGESTHCVLSGHRGLPSAKLFSNLDELELGDTFILHTMDETLTYEVDQIKVVEPDDTSDIEIVPGEDYCTLVTCTPYGVNTHRLLVRGHRTDGSESGLRLTADALMIEPYLLAPVAFLPVLGMLLIWALRKPHRRKAGKSADHRAEMEKRKDDSTT